MGYSGISWDGRDNDNIPHGRLDLDDPWGLFARRRPRQMLTLSAALGYYGLFPADSYPDTHTHKATRVGDQNWRRRIIACQVHLPFPDSRLTGAHIRLYARRPLLLGDADAFEVLEGEAVDASTTPRAPPAPPATASPTSPSPAPPRSAPAKRRPAPSR